MAKYRRKPMVFDAEQWFPAIDRTIYLNGGRDQFGVYRLADQLVIDTLKGHLHVTPGDFIIIGVKGEKHPCKPDIFAITYELCV